MRFEVTIYEDGQPIGKTEKFGSMELAMQRAASAITHRLRRYILEGIDVTVESVYLTEMEWSATITKPLQGEELFGVCVWRSNSDSVLKD